jgi:hypothetical protein
MKEIELMNVGDWVEIKRALEDVILTLVVEEEGTLQPDLVSTYAKVLNICRAYEKPHLECIHKEEIMKREEVPPKVDGGKNEARIYENMFSLTNYDLIKMSSKVFEEFKLWCEESWISCLPCLIDLDDYRGKQFYSVKLVKVTRDTVTTKIIFLDVTMGEVIDFLNVGYQHITTLPGTLRYEQNTLLSDKVRN